MKISSTYFNDLELLEKGVEEFSSLLNQELQTKAMKLFIVLLLFTSILQCQGAVTVNTRKKGTAVEDVLEGSESFYYAYSYPYWNTPPYYQSVYYHPLVYSYPVIYGR